MYAWLLSKNYDLPLKGMKFMLLYTKGAPIPVTLKITKAGIKGLFNRVDALRQYVLDPGSKFEMVELENQIFVCYFHIPQFHLRCLNLQS